MSTYDPTVPDTRTCPEILYDSILELIQIAYDNGMTPEGVDAIIYRILDERAEVVRKSFKVHDSEDNLKEGVEN